MHVSLRELIEGGNFIIIIISSNRTHLDPVAKCFCAPIQASHMGCTNVTHKHAHMEPTLVSCGNVGRDKVGCKLNYRGLS
jgi:hypothetical protein